MGQNSLFLILVQFKPGGAALSFMSLESFGSAHFYTWFDDLSLTLFLITS